VINKELDDEQREIEESQSVSDRAAGIFGF